MNKHQTWSRELCCHGRRRNSDGRSRYSDTGYDTEAVISSATTVHGNLAALSLPKFLSTCITLISPPY